MENTVLKKELLAVTIICLCLGCGNTITSQKNDTEANTNDTALNTDETLPVEADLIISDNMPDTTAIDTVNTSDNNEPVDFDIAIQAEEDVLTTEQDELPDADNFKADPAVIWYRQWGSGRSDEGRGVALDKTGAIFVGGVAGTDFDDQKGPGAICYYKTWTFPCPDLFLTKWDKDGTKEWTRIVGTEDTDIFNSLAVAPDATAYLQGYGNYSFDKSGTAIPNSADDADYMHVSVAVSSDGNRYQIREILKPMPDNPSLNICSVFLSRWSAKSELVWEKSLAIDSDTCLDKQLLIDNENNIILAEDVAAGIDDYGYPLSDILITKFSPTGEKIWSKQYGEAPRELLHALTSDNSGNIIVFCEKEVPFEGQAGGYPTDLLIMKISAKGDLLWTKQWGTPVFDFAGGVAVDNATGDIFAVGSTYGKFEEYTQEGGGFLTKINADGKLLYTKLWISGDYGSGEAKAVTIDADGFLYITGVTTRAPSDGVGDIYLLKWDPSI